MPRRARRAHVPEPKVSWWATAYVLARKSSKGPYEPENVYWRPAQSEHEAMLGLEEIDEDESLSLPLSREKAAERTRKKSAMEKRFFDLHIRMMYRAGVLKPPPKQDCVVVDASPFPAGWKPGQPETAAAN